MGDSSGPPAQDRTGCAPEKRLPAEQGEAGSGGSQRLWTAGPGGDLPAGRSPPRLGFQAPPARPRPPPCAPQGDVSGLPRRLRLRLAVQLFPVGRVPVPLLGGFLRQPHGRRRRLLAGKGRTGGEGGGRGFAATDAAGQQSPASACMLRRGWTRVRLPRGLPPCAAFADSRRDAKVCKVHGVNLSLLQPRCKQSRMNPTPRALAPLQVLPPVRSSNSFFFSPPSLPEPCFPPGWAAAHARRKGARGRRARGGRGAGSCVTHDVLERSVLTRGTYGASSPAPGPRGLFWNAGPPPLLRGGAARGGALIGRGAQARPRPPPLATFFMKGSEGARSS